jgi:hypothetical protein
VLAKGAWATMRRRRQCAADRAGPAHSGLRRTPMGVRARGARQPGSARSGNAAQNRGLTPFSPACNPNRCATHPPPAPAHHGAARPAPVARGRKTQRLAVEHGGQKTGGLVVLEPAAHVHQQGKAGGVALGEAVFTKTLDLLEDGCRQTPRCSRAPACRPPCGRRNLCTPPLRFQAAMERRRVGLARLKPAASMAICITCS